jgi:hypothetical protein
MPILAAVVALAAAPDCATVFGRVRRALHDALAAGLDHVSITLIEGNEEEMKAAFTAECSGLSDADRACAPLERCPALTAAIQRTSTRLVAQLNARRAKQRAEEEATADTPSPWPQADVDNLVTACVLVGSSSELCECVVERQQALLTPRQMVNRAPDEKALVVSIDEACRGHKPGPDGGFTRAGIHVECPKLSAARLKAQLSANDWCYPGRTTFTLRLGADGGYARDDGSVGAWQVTGQQLKLGPKTTPVHLCNEVRIRDGANQPVLKLDSDPVLYRGCR